MKGRTIILDHLGEVEAAALMVDGKLDDLLIDSDAPRPGTVYRAIADRPVKGQGGMFLKTPDGSAFLRQIKGLAPGQPILVQVTGFAEPGKAIPVTAKVLFKSRYAIVTPDAPGLNISRSIKDEGERDRLLEIAHDAADGTEHGLILRSSCVGAEGEDIAEDIAAMLTLAATVVEDTASGMEVLIEGDGPHVLAWREWTEPAEVVTETGGFENHGALDALEDARSALVGLGGGASMYVEPTRALVAVDVNTGNDASLAAGIKANMACARLLPRALRVRGLGGQITLDLAPMPKKDRRAFENALRGAFRGDEVETALVGWTPLGHYELQRKRARVPLSETLA
ncbi:ribonuclease G [Sulfitobacter sp. M57]|uniref:ribonuclease E/G n=1 Tax=unclassified Sulfitobacter TaxID=196795 RepID=UPI0023E18627|nr:MULTISPECIES: ribonuclease E/G [unclassified Sulfitobacter]MDF3415784.1 ribonuclease G [Sulfitobacter sp. KE5]MDF3423264.1 ribonuclease G [Sulfitobacter sp. KE43]MDF3434330.1 ribonuclease G [Sulfitobacter sp. KE42]MDF3459637.1 ribonuclease G [Sulfitobacter sp. S74]MDF3463868.1 ribonuclease G [Sulfitobacter sp. Ks18]